MVASGTTRLVVTGRGVDCRNGTWGHAVICRDGT